MTTAYLDHAATTPMRAEAVEALLPFLSERFGNPSGAHHVARDARRALDEARDAVAAVLGAAHGEVVFTGGGSEADNLAVAGIVRARGGTARCSAIEHHAVLDPVHHLGGKVVAVGADGVVDLDALTDALDVDVSVVSVMAVNNEVGTIEPIAEVARVVREHAPNAVLHTDAVQAAPWCDLVELAAHVDLLTISAHKIGGPKGVGLLMVRAGVALEPLVLGGGQERGRRSGTQDVGGVVAFARALELAAAEREHMTRTVAALRDRFVDTVTAELGDVHETVPRAAKVAGNAHLCIDGVESDAVLFLLDRAGVCASAGSSCSSGALQASHVLAAMGVPAARAAGAVRFTFGPGSSDADVDLAVGALVDAVRRLRG